MLGLNNHGCDQNQINCRPDPEEELQRARKELNKFVDAESKLLAFMSLDIYLGIPNEVENNLLIMLSAVRVGIELEKKRIERILKEIDKESK